MDSASGVPAGPNSPRSCGRNWIRRFAPLSFSFIALVLVLVPFGPILITLTITRGNNQPQATGIKLSDLFTSKLGKFENATSDPGASADIQYAIGPLQGLARWVPGAHVLATFFLALNFLRLCVVVCTSWRNKADDGAGSAQTRSRRCWTRTRQILTHDSIALIAWPMTVLAAAFEIVFIIYLQQAVLTLPVRDNDAGQVTLYSANVTIWPFVVVAFGALCAYLAFLTSYVANHSKVPTTQSADVEDSRSTERWRWIRYALIGCMYLAVLAIWATIFAYLPILTQGTKSMRYTYQDFDLSSAKSSRGFWIAAFVFMALVKVVATVALLMKCCQHDRKPDYREMAKAFSTVNLTTTTSQILYLYLPFVMVLGFGLVCLSAVLAAKATSQLAQSVNQMTLDTSSADISDDSLARLAMPIVPAIAAAVSLYTIVTGTVCAKSACVIYKVLVHSDSGSLDSNLIQSFKESHEEEQSHERSFQRRLRGPGLELASTLITTVACLSACVIGAILQTDPLDGLRVVRWQDTATTGTSSETGVDIYMYQSCPLNQFDRSQAMCDRNPLILSSQFGDWTFTAKLGVIARTAPILFRATTVLVFILTLLYVYLYFKREIHCQRRSLRGKAVGSWRTCMNKNANPVIRFLLLLIVFVLLLTASVASYMLQAELSHGTFALSSSPSTPNPGSPSSSSTSTPSISYPGEPSMTPTTSTTTTSSSSGSWNALSVLSIALTAIPPTTTNALSVLLSAEETFSNADVQKRETSEPTTTPMALPDRVVTSKRDQSPETGGQVQTNTTFRGLLLAQLVIAGLVFLFGLIGLLPECFRGLRRCRGRGTAGLGVEGGEPRANPDAIPVSSTTGQGPGTYLESGRPRANPVAVQVLSTTGQDSGTYLESDKKKRFGEKRYEQYNLLEVYFDWNREACAQTMRNEGRVPYRVMTRTSRVEGHAKIPDVHGKAYLEDLGLVNTDYMTAEYELQQLKSITAPEGWDHAEIVKTWGQAKKNNKLHDTIVGKIKECLEEDADAATCRALFLRLMLVLTDVHGPRLSHRVFDLKHLQASSSVQASSSAIRQSPGPGERVPPKQLSPEQLSGPRVVESRFMESTGRQSP